MDKLILKVFKIYKNCFILCFIIKIKIFIIKFLENKLKNIALFKKKCLHIKIIKHRKN